MGDVIDFAKARERKRRSQPKHSLRGNRSRIQKPDNKQDSEVEAKVKEQKEIREGFTVKDAMALSEVLNGTMIEICQRFRVTSCAKADLFLLGESIISMVLRERGASHPIQKVADTKYQEALETFNQSDPDDTPA